MIIDIGIVAGDIWHYLDEHGKGQSKEVYCHYQGAPPPPYAAQDEKNYPYEMDQDRGVGQKAVYHAAFLLRARSGIA